MSPTRTSAALLRRWRDEFPSWWRLAVDFARFLVKRFRDDQCLLWAGMLCYTTLLSVVPLMAVTFSVIAIFPVFDQWSASLRAFIFDHFVPATGYALQQHLDSFVEQATELSAVGVLALIASSTLLMVNMEKALNRIFDVSSPRSPGNRIIVYWSVLLVGPLLLGASFAISSYLASLPLVGDVATLFGVRGPFFAVLPFISSALAFTLVFMIVPNVSVRWRRAVAGGLVAAVLFETAKACLGAYVGYFSIYRTIYGAFAAIPILLIWVYLSWIVTLIGASFSAALASFNVRSA